MRETGTGQQVAQLHERLMMMMMKERVFLNMWLLWKARKQRPSAPPLRSGHTERGLPQRTAVSVRCRMLHS